MADYGTKGVSNPPNGLAIYVVQLGMLTSVSVELSQFMLHVAVVAATKIGRKSVLFSNRNYSILTLKQRTLK